METFTQFMSPTFLFTQKIDEVPNKLLNQITTFSSINFSSEKFIGLCWISNNLNIKFQYVLITEKRVISCTSRTEQNYFRDVTGIEQNLLQNIIVRSAGNRTALFFPTSIPNKSLRDKLLVLLNEIWVSQKDLEHHPLKDNDINTASNNNIIISTLEKLKELHEKGVLSDKEFNDKKQELIAKII